MSDDLLGQQLLGRYVAKYRLGEGGMGEVYLGTLEGAAGFTKTLVIKRMVAGLASNPEARTMFEREARILSMMKHPSIVGVVDFGIEADGSYLMVMDHIDGLDLHHWLSHYVKLRGPMPVAHALQIIIDVLEALDYAHTLRDARGDSLGIMHRDVSPSNILVDRAGRVVLIDFGIARSSYDPVRTAAGQYKGKFSYMAPELITGGGHADASTDVYATAVVLHEILLGKNTFRTVDPQTTIARVLHHVPEMLNELRRDVSEELASTIVRALSKNPGERFPTARLLRDALIVHRAADTEAIRDALREWVRVDIDQIAPLPEEFRESSARLAAESSLSGFDGERASGTGQHRTLPKVPPPPSAAKPPPPAGRPAPPAPAAAQPAPPPAARPAPSALQSPSISPGTIVARGVPTGSGLAPQPVAAAMAPAAPIPLQSQRASPAPQAAPPPQTAPRPQTAAAPQAVVNAMSAPQAVVQRSTDMLSRATSATAPMPEFGELSIDMPKAAPGRASLPDGPRPGAGGLMGFESEGDPNVKIELDLPKANQSRKSAAGGRAKGVATTGSGVKRIVPAKAPPPEETSSIVWAIVLFAAFGAFALLGSVGLVFLVAL